MPAKRFNKILTTFPKLTEFYSNFRLTDEFSYQVHFST